MGKNTTQKETPMNTNTAPAIVEQLANMTQFHTLIRMMSDLARTSENLNEALRDLEQSADRVREQMTLGHCYAQLTSNGDLMNDPTVYATRVAMQSVRQNEKIEQIMSEANEFVRSGHFTIDHVRDCVEWICHHTRTSDDWHMVIAKAKW